MSEVTAWIERESIYHIFRELYYLRLDLTEHRTLLEQIKAQGELYQSQQATTVLHLAKQTSELQAYFAGRWLDLGARLLELEASERAGTIEQAARYMRGELEELERRVIDQVGAIVEVELEEELEEER